MATIATVLPALTAVVEAAPFDFVETADPFDFEHQPTTNRHKVYRVEAEFTGREGYLGGYALESWGVTVYLARRRSGSAVDTAALLLSDISSLSAALFRAGEASGAYAVSTEDTEGGVTAPGEEQEYLVARLRAAVEFDRAL